MKLDNDMAYILVSEEKLKKRVSELGAQITADYAGKEPLFVGILKGSFIFMADLMRAVDLNTSVDFMCVSSYGNRSTTTGAVNIQKDLSQDIEGKDVIIVEDILDSGITLAYLTRYLANRNPASVRIVTLLNKTSRRMSSIEADYIGFEVPDAFVVGYGLDYAQRYRNVPYIGVLKPEIYND